MLSPSDAGQGAVSGAPAAGRRRRLVAGVVVWICTAASLMGAAAILPGYDIHSFGAALVAALLIGAFNAVLPPIVAALPLPFPLLTGFVGVLLLDAGMLIATAHLLGSDLTVSSWWVALLAALIATALAIILGIVLGTDDGEAHALRVARRIARRSSDFHRTDEPGVVFVEIDGLALPVLRRAIRDGSAPTMARMLESGTHRLFEWETDLSSQTGASQAGILLGANDDIPAFRWVEKERGVVMTCSAPDDCSEIERRHASGAGLLRDGGASRGNLLSGEASHTILTVSRISAEKRANPGYRAFFANGVNATRTLVLFTAEVVREVVAARQAVRRDVRPRGHRGGLYPLMRAAMTVAVRDLIVNAVITDMMIGRPAVYATFSSYDEVAHHSGVERADTLDALRRLDERIGRIQRASAAAARPYSLVVLSDHGQTQGATFLQRNGYTLEDLVQRSLEQGSVSSYAGGDEQSAMVGNALGEAAGTAPRTPKAPAGSLTERDVAVLGSGNLGLVYLMSAQERLTAEQIDELHPRLIPALRAHPHVGFVLVHSVHDGAVALGKDGSHVLATGVVEGADPLAPFGPNAARHLLRSDGFPHVADLMVNSFYDAETDQGCAFEELISFHGGMGGPQTRAFILAPGTLSDPPQPIVGAAAVHDLLWGWRCELHGQTATDPDPAPTLSVSAAR
jgi:uncharacterized membrane protein YvlD (DUF360 family)